MLATSSISFASSSQCVNSNNNNNGNTGDGHNTLLLLIQLIFDTGIQMVFTSWKSGNIITSMLKGSDIGRWMLDSCSNIDTNTNTNTNNNNDNTNDGIGSCMKSIILLQFLPPVCL